MDSFELNKILGAVLGTCLMLVSLNIAAGAIFTPAKPAKPGFDIVVPEHKAGEPKGGQPPPAADPPLEQVLASADISRGETSAKKCAACHSFNKGGPNMVGPNLWGIVGRPKASHPGFNYSQALKAMGGNWTPDELYKFVANPKGMVPGTAMTFSGIPRPGERADLIAYLNTQSDNPAPLTKAAQAPGAPTAR
jgi:cytochrome c